MIRCIETAPGEYRLSGRVDVTTAADLRVALLHAVDSCAALAAVSGATVRFHVSTLELVDAAGLGALVAAHRRAGRQGLGFTLVDVPEPMSRLLFLSRLYRVLATEQSPATEAPRALTPKPRGGDADTQPFPVTVA